jgi:excisionase family DNA binding protein
MTEREEYVTLAQAAERLHMKAPTLARKLHNRQLPGVKVGRQWLIRRDIVDRLLEPEPQAPQGQ